MKRILTLAVVCSLAGLAAVAGVPEDIDIPVVTTATHTNSYPVTNTAPAIRGWVDSIRIVPPAATTGDVEIALIPEESIGTARTIAKINDVASEQRVIPYLYSTDSGAAEIQTNALQRRLSTIRETWRVVITNGTISKTWKIVVRTERE